MDHDAIIFDRTAPAIRNHMLAEIVDRVNVVSVDLPHHLVGSAIHDRTPEGEGGRFIICRKFEVSNTPKPLIKRGVEKSTFDKMSHFVES